MQWMHKGCIGRLTTLVGMRAFENWNALAGIGFVVVLVDFGGRCCRSNVG